VFRCDTREVFCDADAWAISYRDNVAIQKMKDLRDEHDDWGKVVARVKETGKWGRVEVEGVIRVRPIPIPIWTYSYGDPCG